MDFESLTCIFRRAAAFALALALVVQLAPASAADDAYVAALEAYEAGDYTEVRRLAEGLIEAGDHRGHELVVVLHFQGHGRAPDDAAIDAWHHATAAGVERFLAAIGHGSRGLSPGVVRRGVVVDLAVEHGLPYTRRAAAAGAVPAMRFIGGMLFDQAHVDVVEAIAWLRIAYERTETADRSSIRTRLTTLTDRALHRDPALLPQLAARMRAFRLAGLDDRAREAAQRNALVTEERLAEFGRRLQARGAATGSAGRNRFCPQPLGPLTEAELQELFRGAVLHYHPPARPASLMVLDTPDGRICPGASGLDCVTVHACQGDAAALLLVRPLGGGDEVFEITWSAPAAETPEVITRSYRGEPTADAATGCVIRSQMRGAAAMRWDGSCRDGVVAGSGTVTFLDDAGDPMWRIPTGDGYGHVVEDGALVLRVDPSLFAFELTACEAMRSTTRRQPRRAVRVQPAAAHRDRVRDGYLAQHDVADALARVAVRFAARQCPIEGMGYERIEVLIDYGDAQDRQRAIRARSTGEDSIDFAEFVNQGRQQLSRVMAQEARDARARRQAAAREAQARREAAARDARRAEIARQREAAEAAHVERLRAILGTPSAPIANLADLLVYDRSATLAALVTGRQLELTLRNLSFADGKVVFADRHRVSDIYEGIDGDGFAWEAWFETTRNPAGASDVRVICEMSPQTVSGLREGEIYSFTAELLALDDEVARFACAPES